MTQEKDIPVVSGWQPIETAPKEGSPELLGWPHIGRFNRPMPAPMAWQESCNAWRMIAAEGELMGGYSDEEFISGPTHWMPLPEPPNA